jgi:hypothetical protein
MPQTAGTALTAELRRYFSVGPRTRRYRKQHGGRVDLHERMVEAIELAVYESGYWSQGMETTLRAGKGAMLSYRKHVGGYRLNGNTIAAINAMTAWQFAAFLGQMVDAGIENTGKGERYLNAWRAAA